MNTKLTHRHERFGCVIETDLENTIAVLTDQDGEQRSFLADEDHNALWHALQAAKADERTRQSKPDKSEEPTDVITTDVEHVEGADEQ